MPTPDPGIKLYGSINGEPYKIGAELVVAAGLPVVPIYANGEAKTIAQHLGSILPQPSSPAAMGVLEASLSPFINSLPKSDAGLAVGRLWNNGGMICRVEA